MCPLLLPAVGLTTCGANSRPFQAPTQQDPRLNLAGVTVPPTPPTQHWPRGSHSMTGVRWKLQLEAFPPSPDALLMVGRDVEVTLPSSLPQDGPPQGTITAFPGCQEAEAL